MLAKWLWRVLTRLTPDPSQYRDGPKKTVLKEGVWHLIAGLLFVLFYFFIFSYLIFIYFFRPR